MPLWFRVIRIWLPVAVAITCLAGLVEVTVQQTYRTGLDDPQLQLAQDGAARLDSGAAPAALATSPTVDADKSLAPFVSVLGADDAVLASGATLDGSAPKPPAGVLAAVRSPGRDRVTWQPQSGVRIALVGFPAHDGRVVIAGRNMREVEAREDDLVRLIAIGWAAALVAVLLATIAIELVARRFEPPVA
jgi:hypothetical protein